jgi:site-specific recombinase XerD
MSREEVQTEPLNETAAPSGALAASNSTAALRNAAAAWADRNTRPETLARAEKVKDKVSAITSFFDFSGKNPGEVTPQDVSRWRSAMEARGLKPATVYARVSRVSAFFRWLMSDPQLSPSSALTRPRRLGPTTLAPIRVSRPRRSPTAR